MNPIRTPLSAEHEKVGGRMVNFSGFWMPVQYTSIVEEAKTVRSKAGLFDLCHMGRVRIHGKDALSRVERMATCDVSTLKVGAIRYGMLTREDGTIIDDILVYREPETIFLCINAGNRNRDLAWLNANCAGTDARVEDLSESLAMIAIQGPRSVEVVRKLAKDDPGSIKYYGFFRTRFAGIDDVMVSRTGYTGEDGFEFYFEASQAPRVWNELLAAGKEFGVTPIGLGARDTLRLEAGMPLYGHEIDDTTTPFEAGLMWAVKKSFAFIGGDAIRECAERGVHRRLIGFTCADKRVPRAGYAILDGEAVTGDVRSGTFSPTLGKNIGTAYVGLASLEAGRPLALDLRGQRAPIEITPLPFYRRTR